MRGGWVVPPQDVGVRFLLAAGDGFDQRHKVVFKFVQHSRDIRGFGSRFVFVQQRIVRLVLKSNRVGFFAFEFENGFQVGSEN